MCSLRADDAGPNNNWVDPVAMKQTLWHCSTDACGAAPCTSCRSAWDRSNRRIAHIGVELSDSPYVVLNMRIMTRMGRQGAGGAGRRVLRALRALGWHAAGARAGGRTLAVQRGARSTSSTYPRSAAIWSFGSGYGGNALLGKKCFALRIARSWPATRAGWPSTCSSWA